ncbi:SARP family transcriptional regulator [Actinoplanes sp. L3-i22]|nr:SARP family transcriptional regulator [Actinoplanes sp. L3-i22]
MLGPPEVWDGDRLVQLGGPQQRAVLALLLVQVNQVVSTERICERLWGDQAPAAARSLVQGCVAKLRRALRDGPHDPLVTRPPGYLLRLDPDALDVGRFEQLVDDADRLAGHDSGPRLEQARARLRDALALWRGPAYDGIGLPACQAEADRLHERRLATVEKRVDLDLRLGPDAALVAELRELTREHPLRERLWGQLMLALHRTERRADALDAYREIRRALVDELGVEPGPALQRIHRTILADTPPTDPPPAPAPQSGGPAQLPAPVAAFTGRDHDLNRLDTLRAGASIVVICGTAGVGKTALAVQWAHTLRGRYDGGQLYLDLRGYATAGPVAPVEALTGFLAALGVPADRVPTDETQAAALYRSLVADRRMLVLLDNAYGVEQVRPLLPGGPEHLVVVTSRDTLGGLVARDGAAHLRLGVLGPDEAQALLSRVLGAERVAAEPGATAELARLCAHLPLALRIAAADLVTRPARPIGAHVTQLRGDNRLGTLAVDGDPEYAVRAAFGVSYASLRPAARRLFRRLGLAPGPDCTADDAALLGDLDRDTAAGLLGRLAGAHLVDEHLPGRYAGHDLLRLYAAERAAAEEPADQRRAAGQRLLDGYLDRARAAADVLYPHMLRLPGAAAGPAHQDALAWLEAERHNLVIAVGRAAREGPRRSAWLLADALRGYFHLRRYTADWFTVANAALDAARADHDDAGQAAARHSLGTAYRSISDHHEALRQYAKGLGLARRCGWAQAEATALGNLGIVSRKLGRLRAAARQLDAALVIDRRLGRTAGEANNLSMLATVYLEMGDLDRAAEHFAAALELNTLIGSRHGEALALTGLGQVALELGRSDDAGTHLTAARHRYAEVGDRDGAAVTHCLLALRDCDLGRPGPGREHALTALALAREFGDRQTEAMALNALGAADRLRGEPDAAAGHHRHAYQLAQDTGSRRIESEALIGLAAAHHGLGQHDTADALARQALGLARLGGFAVVAAAAQASLASISGAAPCR